MLIVNSKGERVDAYSILPIKLEDYDLIYGGMTTGKTSVHRNRVNLRKSDVPSFIDTDVMWELLTPETSDIWDLKRVSPDVDNVLSGFVRFISHELALRSGVPVLTNMRFPFGHAIKIVRDGEDTYERMKRRARSEGKDLKITKKQVLSWADSWMRFEPEYAYSITLESNEFMSDVFGIRLSADDHQGDLYRQVLPSTLSLLEEHFPGSLGSLLHTGQDLRSFLKEKGHLL